MMHLRTLPTFAALLFATSFAWAQAAPAAPSPAVPAASPGGLLQVLLWLLVVLGLLAGTAWLMKRSGLARAGGTSVAHVIGGVAVGNRERVLVVEVGDQWIVVGVAPGRVNSLATMPKQALPATPPPGLPQPNFGAWLKQTMDKRNAR